MSEPQEYLEARIAAYIDGELPEAEAARLEVFLANTDPQLAERVIGMLSDKHKLMNMPREAAPAELAAHVMEQLERVTLLHDVENFHAPRRSWWQSRLATAAAALLLMGGFGWLVMHTLVQPGGHRDWTKTEIAKNEAPAPSVEAKDGLVEMDRDGAGRVTMDDRKSEGESFRAFKSMEPRAIRPEGPGVPGGMPTTAAPTPPAPMAPAAMKGGRDESAAARGSLAKATSDKSAGEVSKDVSPKLDTKSEETVKRQLASNELIVQNGAAEAKRLNYDSAESAAKALATLSVHGSLATRDPVVVTLVARDAQDPENLRTTLQSFMNDPGTSRQQFTLQTRYNSAPRNLDSNSLVINGTANYTGGANISGGMINNNSGGVTQGNVTTSGNAAAATQLTNNGNSDSFLVYKGRSFDAIEGNFTGTNLTINNAGLREQQQRMNNGDLSAPYRVVLREDQLQKITSDFQVSAVSCGSRQFVIAPEVSLADAGKNSGKVGVRKSESIDRSVGAGGGARPESSTLVNEKERQKEKADGAQKFEGLKQQQAAQPLASQAQEGSSERWIDCVIKMEPRARASYQMNQAAPTVPAANQQNQPPAK